jgi:hypothetical protein
VCCIHDSVEMQATICLFESHKEVHICTVERSSNGRAENMGPCRAVDGDAELTSTLSSYQPDRISVQPFDLSVLAWNPWCLVLAIRIQPQRTICLYPRIRFAIMLGDGQDLPIPRTQNNLRDLDKDTSIAMTTC